MSEIVLDGSYVSTEYLQAMDAALEICSFMDIPRDIVLRSLETFRGVPGRGETLFVANLDAGKGLPRIRGYCRDILADLESKGVGIDRIVGGLDEYSVVGEQMRSAVDEFSPDLTIILGICHAVPGMGADDILITDQPRQLANYLNTGCQWAVGEIASHSMVMGAHSIVPLETADTLRELL